MKLNAYCIRAYGENLQISSAPQSLSSWQFPGTSANLNPKFLGSGSGPRDNVLNGIKALLPYRDIHDLGEKCLLLFFKDIHKAFFL